MPPKAAITVATTVSENNKKVKPSATHHRQSKGYFQKSAVTCANSAITRGQTHQGNYMSTY